MGDSGEGLVDAEARIQEQIEEREAERRRRSSGGRRSIPSGSGSSNRCGSRAPSWSGSRSRRRIRCAQQQIQAALAEIDKRLAAK